MWKVLDVCIGNIMLGLYRDQWLHRVIQFAVYTNQICSWTYGINAIVFLYFPFDLAIAYRILQMWNPSFRSTRTYHAYNKVLF